MKWRWARDGWLSKGGVFLAYDKLEHFLTYFFLTIVGKAMEFTSILPVLMIVGFLWEVKDALVPYEKFGFWGGDGFSWKDLVANTVGIVLGYGIISLLM